MEKNEISKEQLDKIFKKYENQEKFGIISKKDGPKPLTIEEYKKRLNKINKSPPENKIIVHKKKKRGGKKVKERTEIAILYKQLNLKIDVKKKISINQNYRTHYANQNTYNATNSRRIHQQYQPTNPPHLNQLSYQQYYYQYQTNVPRLNQQSFQQQQVPFNRPNQQSIYQKTNQQYYPNSRQAYQNNAFNPNIHQQQQYNNQNPNLWMNTNQNSQNFKTNTPQIRPLAPKPQAAPEPMENDQSLKSQAVNYANLPKQNQPFATKRANSSVYNQQKQQKNFHINSYGDNIEEVDEQEVETFQDYMEHWKNGYIMKILIDTGSNKNYIKNRFVDNPKTNEPFWVGTVCGEIEINEHTFVNLFGLKDKIKFHVLKTLESFDAILGSDSLKELNAVIHMQKNIMIIRNRVKVQIKECELSTINHLTIREDHLNTNEKIELRKVIDKYKNLFNDPNKKLTYTTTITVHKKRRTAAKVMDKLNGFTLQLQK